RIGLRNRGLKVRILPGVLGSIPKTITTNQNIGFLISLMFTDGARYSTNGGTGGGQFGISYNALSQCS
ncbi:MAG: hypothetical protein ACOVOJ_12100, partial [Pirellula sp.]